MDPAVHNCKKDALSPSLAAAAATTSAVVTAVVAASVAGAVAGSVAGAVAGSSAAPAPGASVYQLIGATQFMGLFGKMVDKSQPPEPIEIEKPLTEARRRRMIQENRLRRKSEEEKSEASAFSDAFAWANLKFDNLFKFNENSCGKKFLSDFWATTGTFISAVCGSFGFRTILDFFTRKAFAHVSGEAPQDAIKGMEPGAHELHIIKTSHLGLCQAMGALLCVAKYSGCPCGWLNNALWSMAIMWLFAMPIGAMVLLAWQYYDSSRRGAIHFEQNPGSSWMAFFKKIGAVQSEKGAESFVNPPTVHAMIKFLLAIAGALCTLLGLKATMTFSSFGCALDCTNPATGKYDVRQGFKYCTWGEDPVCEPTAPEMIVLWVMGVLLTALTSLIGSKMGRSFIVALTNSISKSIGIEYKMHPETLVIKPWHKPTPGLRGEPGKMNYMGRTLTQIADLSAKFSALTDPDMQKDLRVRGKWKNKDTFAMFYGDFNHNGIIWALFLMLKNLLVGIMLTNCDVTMCSIPCPCGTDAEYTVSAPLLGLDGKVWTIAVMYLLEFLVLAFFSPDNDLINGYKMAFQQMQQSIVMLIAALTATNYISAEAGAGALVTLGTIQVALAMPEQIFGVVKTFVLKSGDKTKAPDFPTTQAELDLKDELSIGMEKKLNSAKEIVDKAMKLGPFMKAGNVEEVFRRILMDKELMELFNVLNPGCLNGLFGTIFTLDPIVDGLTMIKDNMIIIKAPVDKLLAVEWVHCVDFKIGIDALYDIKEAVETLGDTIRAMMAGKVDEAVGVLMGSGAMISCLEV